MPFNRTPGQKDEQREEGKKKKEIKEIEGRTKGGAVTLMIEGLVLSRSSEQAIVKKWKVIPVPEELRKQLRNGERMNIDEPEQDLYSNKTRFVN